MNPSNTAVHPDFGVDHRPEETLAPSWAAPPVDASVPRAALANLRAHLLQGGARLVALVAVDLAAILIARGLLRLARAGYLGGWVGSLATDAFPSGAIPGAQLAVAVVASFFFLGCYREGHRWREPVKILTAAAIGTVVAFYADLWHGSATVVAGRALFVWLLLGPLLVGVRALAVSASKMLARAGMQHRVLEVTGRDDGEAAMDLGPSYRTLAQLTRDDLPADVRSMERWLDGGIDTIFVRGDLPGERFQALTDFALAHGCRLLCAPHWGRAPGVERKRVWIEGHPLLELTTPGLRASHLVLKRVLDLVVASLTVVALAPVLFILGVWVKLDSRGAVFFRQMRPGIHGRPFAMLKFRSMHADAEEVLGRNSAMYQRFLGNGCKLPVGEDPRITTAGRFLRRTSLDELPQLFNVIRGDMSLVGPRPLVGPELENYGERIPTLLSVKPGMTGLWQVSGRSQVPFPERAEMDLEYVRKWSFLGDIWILLLTPLAVLVRRGAH